MPRENRVTEYRMTEQNESRCNFLLGKFKKQPNKTGWTFIKKHQSREQIHMKVKNSSDIRIISLQQEQIAIKTTGGVYPACEGVKTY